MTGLCARLDISASGFFIFAALSLADNVWLQVCLQVGMSTWPLTSIVRSASLWAHCCRPVQIFYVMSQSWPLSQEANKSSGVCSVCLGGTVHRHGPRDAPCPCSNTLPFSVTAQRGKSGYISDQPAPSAKADKTTPGSSGPSSQLSDRPIWTPICRGNGYYLLLAML